MARTFTTEVDSYFTIERIIDNDTTYAAYEMTVQVVKVTEKAVQVKCGNSSIKVWFPKSALITTAQTNVVYAAKVADWFEVNEWYIKAEQKYAKRTI